MRKEREGADSRLVKGSIWTQAQGTVPMRVIDIFVPNQGTFRGKRVIQIRPVNGSVGSSRIEEFEFLKIYHFVMGPIK